MSRWIGGALLGVLLCLVIDLGVTMLQARLFQLRVGNSEFLPVLCERVKTGMTRSEVERQLAGFRELRQGKEREEYEVAYAYWFGIIPPLGVGEIKLVGEIVVTFQIPIRRRPVRSGTISPRERFQCKSVEY